MTLSNMTMKTVNLKDHLTDLVEAGIDEAGRGPLAGPVFAAAVILPVGFFHPLLNDSKQMSRDAMLEVREYIQKEAVAWAVASSSAQIIDRENILRATILTMNEAVRKLTVKPQYLLVDGNRFQSLTGIPYRLCIKGDATFASIAAASVLAKTYRDEFMIEIAKEYPGYGWEKNFGYPTKAHRDAIRTLGITPHHRKSFKLI